MIENLLRPGHLLVIAIVYLVFFGPAKLPELGKSLGEALVGFKRGLRDAAQQLETEVALEREGKQEPPG